MKDAMTTITISGLGGAINFEMKLVEKALKDAGFIVEVNNDAADWVVSADPAWHDRVLANIKENGARSIKLVARHIPWGG